MVTLKQLEALYWIAELGSFEQAAKRLNSSQSAISKRIQELEQMSLLPVFDRSKRSARLTEHGQRLVHQAEKVLFQREQLNRLMKSDYVHQERIRMGVTELTALTWLPQLVQRLRERYSGIDVQPEVDSALTLHEALLNDELDVIVVPDSAIAQELNVTNVGQVDFCWMCSPDYPMPKGRVDLNKIENWTALVQGQHSGIQLIYQRWFDELNIRIGQKLTCNSLIALTGLVVSGLGVGYVPSSVARSLEEVGLLREVFTEPPPPSIPYVALYRKHRLSDLEAKIVHVVQETCNFNQPIYALSHLRRHPVADARYQPQ